MKLFQSAQKTFTLFGISSNKHPWNTRTLIFVFNFMAQISFYILYLINIANTFKEYSDNIYLTSSTSIITFGYVVFVFKKKKTFEFIDLLEKCTEKRVEDSESETIYTRTNQFVEKMSNILYIIVGEASPLIWIMPKFFGCLFFYFTTDLGNDALESPLPMWYRLLSICFEKGQNYFSLALIHCNILLFANSRLPFDWKNLPGYFIAVIIQCVLTSSVFILLAAGASFTIGSFLIAVSISDDIKGILKSINKDAKSKKNRSKILNKIADFIQIQSILKQLVHDFNEIFQPMIVEIFVWSCGGICATMLMFQVELSRGEIDSVVIFVAIFYASYAFGGVFIACELGQRMSDECEEICDLIGEFNWYRFPDKLKSNLTTIIIVAQQPVEIECFGSITCSRFSFKKVIKSSYSYFTVFRKFMD